MLRLSLFLCAIGAPAFAQQQCTSVDDALATMASKYGEAPRISALMGNGNLIILTAAPEGGWTMLVVMPDKQACIMASGQAFEVHDAPIPGMDG